MLDYSVMSFVLESKDRLEKMVDNARKQGISEEKIKQLVSLGVLEMLKKVKELQKI